MTAPPLPIVVNVVTPCSRPQNLPLLRRSLDEAAARAPNRVLRWWVIADGRAVTDLPADLRCHHAEVFAAAGCAGHAQRNRALELIDGGWVYHVDDDNLMHEGFLAALEVVAAAAPHVQALVVAQRTPDGVRPPRPVARCRIDTGQFATTRALVGDARWAEGDYCADGSFIEALYARNPAAFCLIDSVLAYYNRLRF